MRPLCIGWEPQDKREHLQGACGERNEKKERLRAWAWVEGAPVGSCCQAPCPTYIPIEPCSSCSPGCPPQQHVGKNLTSLGQTVGQSRASLWTAALSADSTPVRRTGGRPGGLGWQRTRLLFGLAAEKDSNGSHTGGGVPWGRLGSGQKKGAVGRMLHMTGGGMAGVLGPHAARPAAPRLLRRAATPIRVMRTQAAASASPTGSEWSSGVARLGSCALCRPAGAAISAGGGVVAREPRESSAGRRVLRWGGGCLPSCRRQRQLVAAVGTLLPHSMAFQGRSGASQRLFLAGERANRGQNKGLSAGSPCSVWRTEQAQSVDRYPTVQPQSATLSTQTVARQGNRQTGFFRRMHALHCTVSGAVFQTLHCRFKRSKLPTRSAANIASSSSMEAQG